MYSRSATAAESYSVCLIINSWVFRRDRQFVSGFRNLTDRRKRLGWTRWKGKCGKNNYAIGNNATGLCCLLENANFSCLSVSFIYTTHVVSASELEKKRRVGLSSYIGTDFCFFHNKLMLF